MTNHSFDGLVVHHGGMDEMAQHLHAAVNAIDTRMNELERDLAPLHGDWSGNAQRAYHVAKTQWDNAIGQMRGLLDETAAIVVQSNQEYQAADLRGARQFQIH